MAMDWAGYGDYAVQPMEEIEDEEDFYSEQNHVNGIDQCKRPLVPLQSNR
jgi:hypothetical protein